MFPSWLSAWSNSPTFGSAVHKRRDPRSQVAKAPMGLFFQFHQLLSRNAPLFGMIPMQDCFIHPIPPIPRPLCQLCQWTPIWDGNPEQSPASVLVSLQVLARNWPVDHVQVQVLALQILVAVDPQNAAGLISTCHWIPSRLQGLTSMDFKHCARTWVPEAGAQGEGGQKMVEIILMPSCAGCGYTMLNPQFSHRDSAKLLLQDPQKCGRSKPGHQTTNVSENRLPLIPLIYHDSSLFMIVPIWTWPLGGYNPYFQTHTPWWLSPWRRCKVRISECQQPGAPTQTTQPNIDMAPDAEF